MEKSAFQIKVEQQTRDPLAHYEAQLEALKMHNETIDLLRQSRHYVGRCTTIGAQQLSQRIAEFLAKNGGCEK